MLAPKRFLPSLSMLSIFEAAERTGSFSAAAEELCLTQSAVSRQIKSLEDQLENVLFVRDRQTVRVTVAGARYAQAVREALLMIANASLNLRANPETGTLNIATQPALGARWLVPLLPKFLDANPGVIVNLCTQTELFDFQKENLDAALYYGKESWVNTDAVFLMKERMTPVCSADFLKKHPIKQAEDAIAVPLLHLACRPDAWERWFRFEDIAFDCLTGMLVDRFETLLESAKNGMGLALLPDFIVQQELSNGSIVTPFNTWVDSEEGYYFVWPKDSKNLPSLIAFKGWLQKQTPNDEE